METFHGRFDIFKDFLNQPKPSQNDGSEWKIDHGFFSDHSGNNTHNQTSESSSSDDGSRSHYSRNGNGTAIENNIKDLRLAIHNQNNSLKLFEAPSEIERKTEDKYNEKTDNEFDEDFTNIDLKETIRNSVARRFRRHQNQTKIPFKEFFRSSLTPDYDKVITGKIISTQKGINKACILRDLTKKFGPVSLTRSTIRRKFITYFNRLIDIQPLPIKPISSDMEALVEITPKDDQNMSISSSSEDESIEIRVEPRREFPPESYRTPEKQKIRKIDANTLRSKIQTGILIAPKNYKSNIDCLRGNNKNEKDLIDLFLPNAVLDVPMVYELDTNDNFNFKPELGRNDMKMVGFSKIEPKHFKLEDILAGSESLEDNVDYEHVLSRPKKQPRYDRSFKNNFEIDSTNLSNESAVLKQTTPRRKLNYSFKNDSNTRPPFDDISFSRDNISKNILLDLSDMKPLVPKDYSNAFKNGFQAIRVNDVNDNETRNCTVSDPDKYLLENGADDEKPKPPNTPYIKFYPRLMH